MRLFKIMRRVEVRAKRRVCYACAVMMAVTVLPALLAGCSERNVRDDGLETLYAQLDSELEKSHVYQAEKEQRIGYVRDKYVRAASPTDRMTLAGQLIDEYESYVSDSALYYIDRAMSLAHLLGDSLQVQRLHIRRADVMSHAGLFAEAQDILDNLKRSGVDSSLMENYYSVFCTLYQYISEYNNDSIRSKNTNALRSLYTDSVNAVASPSSFNYIVLEANEQIVHGNIDSTIALLKSHLKEFQSGTRSYSIIASIIAYGYKRKNDSENFKRYLTLSAISDTRAVVKENMSFRELSTVLFYDGDIVRANKYLKKSFEDANFYAARMRTAQSSRMLPVIDDAYNAKQSQLQSRLEWLLILTVALALGLTIFIVLTLRQMRRTNRANRIIRRNNVELKEVSSQLRRVNDELAVANAELKNSDRVKEEYAGLFMEFSSITISNLEHYHTSLRNLAVQGSVKAILKRLDSNSIADKTLRDFYVNFDEAILNIYPNFVENVNRLLREDGRIVIRSGARLNTELRIVALIRIGISDTEKISDFLRCSITTVYTYRSKLRKRALNPDTFEEDILKINH
ncbi:MAG: hypothetical protein J6C81_08550 [Muribaculaceae bacterium]|nr:hypothetical protein [Muribaculaceae bacterium]